MIKSRDKILFLSHEASATGAPIFLLEFIKHAKNRLDVDYDFDIVLIKDGPLDDQFEALGRTLKLYNYRNDAEQASAFRDFIKNNHYAIAHYNTLECAHILSWLELMPEKKNIDHHLFHIHELEGIVQRYGGHNKIKIIDEKADFIIVDSQEVRDNLVFTHKFDKNKIDVIPPLTRSVNVLTPREITAFKKELGLSDRKIVLACGDISARKGVDFFLNLAFHNRSSTSSHKPYFMWLGPDTHKQQPFYEKEIRIKNEIDNIGFRGFIKDTFPYFNACDAFLMVSREDPHPLVCLEAAALKKPVIYFKEAGGISSFFGQNSGFAAKFCDLEDTHQKLEDALNLDKSDIRIEAAHKRYIENYNPDLITQQIYESIRLRLGLTFIKNSISLDL